MFLPSFNSYHLSTHPTLCPALFSLLVLPKQRQKPTTNNKTKTNPKLQKLKTIKRPKRKKNAEAKQNKKYTKKQPNQNKKPLSLFCIGHLFLGMEPILKYDVPTIHWRKLTPLYQQLSTAELSLG